MLDQGRESKKEMKDQEAGEGALKQFKRVATAEAPLKRMKRWDECGIEEKVEWLRDELRQLLRGSEYISEHVDAAWRRYLEEASGDKSRAE